MEFQELHKVFSELTSHSDIEILHSETLSERLHCNQQTYMNFQKNRVVICKIFVTKN
jgi:hypothetical protein